MKPVIALLGNSIFITTISTSLRTRAELSVEQLNLSSPTILEQLRRLNPNALLLDPSVACPEAREKILTSFAANLTKPLVRFEFCNNNKQLHWKVILPAQGIIDKCLLDEGSINEHSLEELVSDAAPTEKQRNVSDPPKGEALVYEIACIDSLIQAITEVCRNYQMHQNKSAPSTTEQLPDEALLRACRTGDAQAWETLLDRYERLVFSIARNTGLGTEDASDITQLTFGYLLQSLDRMTDEGSIRAWLATVAKRHSRRLLVRQLRYHSTEINEEVIDGLMPNRSMPNHTGSGGIERWELAEWIRSGLEHIDERCRRLLRILYFDQEEPSYAEVAESLGLAEGSVGPIRARCLKRLREVM